MIPKKMHRIASYITIMYLYFGLLTAQPHLVIKKIHQWKPYRTCTEDYCELGFPVNATFVPSATWYKIDKNGEQVEIDVNGNRIYEEFCDKCEDSSCEFFHWRFCDFRFILRIYKKENEQMGQYVARIGQGEVFENHTFPLSSQDAEVRSTISTLSSPTSSANNNEKVIVLTNTHMYIGIGVAAGIVVMFIIVFICICRIARKRRSEHKGRDRGRHHRPRDREESVISNFVSNHTYADISGVYDGLNPETRVHGKNSYTMPQRNNDNIDGATNCLHPPDHDRKGSAASAGGQSYLEPVPLVYQMIGTNKNQRFPSSSAYDDSAFQTKVNIPPPMLPPKSSRVKQETDYINVNQLKKVNNKVYKR